MLGEVFELPEPLITPTHQLRRTYEGIQELYKQNRDSAYTAELAGAGNRPFLAWDGEGWTDVDGEHRYMLLQASTGQNISAPRLTTREMLAFLIKVAAENQKVIHVIYGGGYDATHWLRDLPLTKRVELKTNGMISVFMKDTNGRTVNRYKIEYIPHKWTQITGWHWGGRKTVTIKIFDVMTFFQSSFIDALESRGIEIPEAIRSGKANRQNFTYHDLDEIREYCKQELEMLVELCGKLREEFREAGINVTQFHGPGAVASAIFKSNKIRVHMQEPPVVIERALQRAYFGGRFEQFKAGHYEGKVYSYDINSAYPDKIRNLPSLEGARWEYTTDYDGSPGVWFCSHDDGFPTDVVPYPLPWRGRAGNVGFPRINTGVWVWHFEAKHATTVHYGYKLITPSDEKPFAFVADMYKKRQQWKKERRGGERALKLALN